MLCGYLLKQKWECSIGCDSAYGKLEVGMGDPCPYDDMAECPCFFSGDALFLSSRN